MKMKTISTEELKTILENHKYWLNDDGKGREDMRADLSYADLSNADLDSADLSYADLSNVDLRGASLNDADLSYANLRGANLIDANLSYANLRGADLRGADLNDADLRGANLNDANLIDAKNLPYIPTVCPEEGAFIGWKKAKTKRRYVIVKLEIPASAKRSSATSRKCRCDKAKVLEIYNLDGAVSEERKCYSSRNDSFIYEVGKIVKVDDFDEDRWNECSQGIHFFINRQEAVDY